MKRRELEKLVEREDQLTGALSWVSEFVRKGLPAGPVAIRLGRERRTLDQNAKLWPMCTDISRQVEWHGKTLTPDEWKDVFTASLKKQKVVPGLDGEFVIVGGGSSKLTKREFVDLIELIYAFGSERDVIWREPAKQTIHEYTQARAA